MVCLTVDCLFLIKLIQVSHMIAVLTCLESYIVLVGESAVVLQSMFGVINKVNNAHMF